MDGLTYSISEGLVADGNVPSVAEVSVVRHELGHTDFVIEISNLRPGFTLPVRLETIPSQCFLYAVSSPLGFELPHNIKSIIDVANINMYCITRSTVYF